MPPPRTFGKGNGGVGWTADELHAAILEKIISHTSKPTERYREAFRLFGRPSHGLRHQVFREVLRSWGIELSAREARKVFAKFAGAKHADSPVDFRLFVLRLLGSSDFTAPLWNVERDKEAERVEWARKAHVKAMGVGSVETISDPVARRDVEISAFPPSLAKSRWNTDEIARRIIELLRSRTSGGPRQQHAAYKLFALAARQAGGLTPQVMQDRLREMGLTLQFTEVEALFERWADTTLESDSTTPVISFQGFCSRVMPASFTAKLWNAKRDDERERAEAKERRRGQREARRIARINKRVREARGEMWPSEIASEQLEDDVIHDATPKLTPKPAPQPRRNIKPMPEPTLTQRSAELSPNKQSPDQLLTVMRSELERTSKRLPHQVPPAMSTHLNQRAPNGSYSAVLGAREHRSRPRTGTSEYERAMAYAKTNPKLLVSPKIGSMPRAASRMRNETNFAENKGRRQSQVRSRKPMDQQPSSVAARVVGGSRNGSRVATPWLRPGRT